MQGTLQSREAIESAASQYGVAPGPAALMKQEAAAAHESVRSGVYITWVPLEDAAHDPTVRVLVGMGFAEDAARAAAARTVDVEEAVAALLSEYGMSQSE